MNGYLSETTWKVRRSLLLMCVVAFGYTYVGIVPRRLTAFNVEFDRVDQIMLARMLAVGTVYFLFEFLDLAHGDYVSAHRDSEQRKPSGEHTAFDSDFFLLNVPFVTFPRRHLIHTVNRATRFLAVLRLVRFVPLVRALSRVIPVTTTRIWPIPRYGFRSVTDFWIPLVVSPFAIYLLFVWKPNLQFDPAPDPKTVASERLIDFWLADYVNLPGTWAWVVSRVPDWSIGNWLTLISILLGVLYFGVPRLWSWHESRPKLVVTCTGLQHRSSGNTIKLRVLCVRGNRVTPVGFNRIYKSEVDVLERLDPSVRQVAEEHVRDRVLPFHESKALQPGDGPYEQGIPINPSGQITALYVIDALGNRWHLSRKRLKALNGALAEANVVLNPGYELSDPDPVPISISADHQGNEWLALTLVNVTPHIVHIVTIRALSLEIWDDASCRYNKEADAFFPVTYKIERLYPGQPTMVSMLFPRASGFAIEGHDEQGSDHSVRRSQQGRWRLAISVDTSGEMTRQFGLCFTWNKDGFTNPSIDF